MKKRNQIKFGCTKTCNGGQWRDSGGTVVGQWRDSGGRDTGRDTRCPAGRPAGHREGHEVSGRTSGRTPGGTRSVRPDTGRDGRDTAGTGGTLEGHGRTLTVGDSGNRELGPALSVVLSGLGGFGMFFVDARWGARPDTPGHPGVPLGVPRV